MNEIKLAELPRFAVLDHQCSPKKPDHLDIVLEVIPGDNPEDLALDKFETLQYLQDKILQADYQGRVRRRYLSYEGPMSGNRGFVRRIDEGIYRITDRETLIFEGNSLCGEFEVEEQKWMKRVKQW